MSDLQVKASTLSSTGITLNLSSMADSRLDTKLEHFLTHYFLARGNNHEIRLMFKEIDFYKFEEFTSCEKEEGGQERRFIDDIQQKKTK